MTSDLEQWLALAPRPAPLTQAQRWQVFISYRSVNRFWVLELYDILRHLGYSVFLDQYVLSAAAPLALSLGEELDASASAVLVWSSSFEDSEWCKKEFNYLEYRETRDASFKYVIAKLDGTVLPGTASGKAFVDFSNRREGPGGSDILRLLYGLSGKPLPPEAVRLAADLDEGIRAARAKIQALRIEGDAEALGKLSESDSLPWTASPMLGCEVAEALIALRQYDKALSVTERLCEQYPKALRPRQLRGLAFARKGEWLRAQTILGELYIAGEIDPETLGIYGRTWMERFNVTQERRHLLKARDLYRQAFEATPKDYYTGVNAATKSLLLGERETAQQIATRVQQVTGKDPVPNDYWRTATIAEIHLLQGEYASAGALYEAAVSAAPEEIGSHESSCKQASLILDHLGSSDDERRIVLKAFGHLSL